ncbi:androgen-dependent TFPI-regulating protein-like [Maniola jurtina]|uniref:androgen-dependent TFPI-regulating protein-like n=1 Tax=Maniola jurtina TaxID=191418 RepID=UPI001E68DC83|nr:androgen-dependent TFPI-regulating protein-like [Maniola jurtina]
MTKLITLVRETDGLLRFRLLVYLLAFVHLVILSIRLLGKDFEHSEDVTIQLYAKFKWKLITTWFSLLTYPYIPICLYCDWRELKGDEMKHVKILKKIRDFTFTNLLLPTTVFADILFWRLWYHDKALVMPPPVGTVIHLWEHHSMHTVSLGFVIFDLIFVKRERPKSMGPGIIAMLGFISVYVTVCVHSILNEEYLYPVFRNFSPYKLLVLAVYTYISFLFYHTGQWLVIDLFHGQKKLFNKKN